MIKRIRIQNYKALKDVTLDLTPFHVLIGPNDSGKTSILEAIAALCRSVDHDLPTAFLGRWSGRELVTHQKDLPVIFDVEIHDEPFPVEYTLTYRFPLKDRKVIVEEEGLGPEHHKFTLDKLGQRNSTIYRAMGDRERFLDMFRLGGSLRKDKLTKVIEHSYDTVCPALTGVHLYRWNPRWLSLPTVIDSRRRFRMDPSGFGLALCLYEILGYDREQFSKLESRFRQIFPQIRSIKLMTETAYGAPPNDALEIPLLQQAQGKGIHFELNADGTLIPASQVSDGVLLVLAYLTILYLPEPPRTLLIEEPENGIHPKRLQEVMGILRQLVEEQGHTQVIMTTHSPYLLDLFKPEEVTLCQKKEDGTISTHRLSESKTVRQQMDIFTLGEIWTAEGDEGLVSDGESNTESTEEPVS